MMRQHSIFKTFLAAFLALPLVCSCFKDNLFEGNPGVPEGEPVTMSIPFSATGIDKVDVGTKTLMTEDYEYRIYNIYVMLFDASGNKFYGRLFSPEDLVGSREIDNTYTECWTVTNRSGSGTTIGEVKISTISQSGCTIWIGANVGLAGGNVSGESTMTRFNAVQTLAEFQSLKMALNEETINRNGYLPMGGVAEGFNTGNVGDTVVHLKRFDAKVTVLVRHNETNIKSIKPLTWKVYNLPCECYVYERTVGTPSCDSGENYFDTQEFNFSDKAVIDGVTWQEITFYMLENRLPYQKSIPEGEGNYYLREKQLKEDDGKGGVNNLEWEYANLNSAYLVFSADLVLTHAGVVDMLEEDVDRLGMTTHCQYTIHLGDFLSCDDDQTHNYNDYNTCRNHSYTYYVVINNAKQVYVEVDKNGEEVEVEPQPSVIGNIVLASKQIFSCDAHYESHILDFSYMRSEDIVRYSWYVNTPFSTGFPTKEGVVDGNLQFSDSGLDDKWVQFRLNVDNGSSYSNLLQSYPPAAQQSSELMDVGELIDFLYQEAKKWESDDPAVHQSSKYYGGSAEPRDILVTAFVNEYYYETDPLTGQQNPALWRIFTEAPDREMHILTDARLSKDKESSVIESFHSIIQRSIKTIYNVNAPTLNSLWGTECVDEYVDKSWPCGDNADAAARQSGDNYSGRYNSSLILDLPGNWDSAQWSDYLSFNVEDGESQFVQNEQQRLLYTCLARNRDNDGDGKIDEDEYRWYLPAIGQLNALWIGADALPYDVRLYSGHEGTLFHYISSTTQGLSDHSPSLEGRRLSVIWSEEGGSTSDLGLSYEDVCEAYPSDPWIHFSTRCVRNIGNATSGGSATDVTYRPVARDEMPQQYFAASSDGEGHDKTMTFVFDYLNPKALRYYTGMELSEGDEYSVQNRVYKSFSTQSLNTVIDLPKGVLPERLNAWISAKGVNDYCPEGYRLPNQREASLIALNHKTVYGYDGEWYVPAGADKRAPTRTYFSYGYYGYQRMENDIDSNRGCYLLQSDRDCLSNAQDAQHNATLIRCVRDVDESGELTIDLQLSDSEAHTQNIIVAPGDALNVVITVDSPYSDLYEIVYSWRYTNKDGLEETKTFTPVTFDESTRTFRYDVTDHLPASSAANLEFWQNIDLSHPIIIRAVAINNAGTRAVAQSSFSVRAVSCSIAKPADDIIATKQSLFKVAAESFTSNNLAVMKVEYKKSGESVWTEVGATGAKVRYYGAWTPPFSPGSSKQYNSGNQGTAPLSFVEGGDYQVRITAGDGYITTASEPINVTVLDYLPVVYYDNVQGKWVTEDPETSITLSSAHDLIELPVIDWGSGDYLEIQLQGANNNTPLIVGNRGCFPGSSPGYPNGNNTDPTNHKYGSYSFFLWPNKMYYCNDNSQHELCNVNPGNEPLTIRISDGQIAYKVGSASDFTVVSGSYTLGFQDLPSTLTDRKLYVGYQAGSTAQPTNGHINYIKVVHTSTGPVSASGVSIPATERVAEGHEITITPQVTPSAATIVSSVWSCTPSDGSVVTVTGNSDGTATVRGISNGTASITVTVTDELGGEVTSDPCVVEVFTPVDVTSVSVDSALAMALGGSGETLTATVSPTNADIASVEWTSSPSGVVSIAVNSENKLEATVSPVAAGTASVTVTVTDIDGNTKTATCNVTVLGVSLDQPTLSLSEDGSAQTLTATITPSSGSYTVSWQSGDTAVATVTPVTGNDRQATVSPVSSGNTDITVTVTDNTNNISATATCHVTVTGGSTPSSPEVILWQNYDVPTDAVQTKTLNIISSGTPSDTDICFANGDYIEMKFHKGELPSSGDKDLFQLGGTSTPYVNITSKNNSQQTILYYCPGGWTDVYSTNLNVDDSIYIRYGCMADGTQGPGSYSTDGITWTNFPNGSSTAESVWASIISRKTLQISTARDAGHLQEVTYDYVKIVRGGGGGGGGSSTTAVTGITLNPTSAILSTASGPQHTQQISASVTPADADDTAVVWESSNNAVATVNSSGLVTAVSPGSATITATAHDGSGVNATCSVSVFNPLTSVSISGGTSVAAGSSITLTATPDANTSVPYSSYNWTCSSGTGTATMTDNHDGTVTVQGGNVGTVSISVQLTDSFGNVASASNYEVEVTEVPAVVEQYYNGSNWVSSDPHTPTTLSNGANSLALPAVNWENGDYIEVKFNTGSSDGVVLMIGKLEAMSNPWGGGDLAVVIWGGNPKAQNMFGSSNPYLCDLATSKPADVTLRISDGKIVYSGNGVSETTWTGTLSLQNSSITDLFLGSNMSAVCEYIKVVNYSGSPDNASAMPVDDGVTI